MKSPPENAAAKRRSQPSSPEEDSRTLTTHAAAARLMAANHTTETEPEEMPFIAFDAFGQGASEHQKVIRQHLGRQRRKKTSEARTARESGRKSSERTTPDLDFSSFLCSCEPQVPAVIQAMLDTGRPLLLQPCPKCRRGRIEQQQLTDELSPVPDAGPLCANPADPFGALPVSPKPYTHELIRHFVDVTGPSTLPFPRQAHLFPNVGATLSLIAHDEVLVRAVISIAGMHQDFLHGRPTLSPVTLEERGNAITLLNQRLSETTIIPSDGLIIAINILGTCETLADNQASWRAHTLGLLRLIQMRGGLHHDDAVRASVLEGDVIGAMMFDVQPFFTEYVDLEEFKTDEAANLPYEFIIIQARLRQTFVEIRTLCDLIEPYFPEVGMRTATADKDFITNFAYRRSAIEYQLLTLDPISTDDDDTMAATECCRIAAQIFVNLVFRSLTPGEQMHSRLAERLRRAIIAFDQDYSSQHAITMLLWASVLGYLASKDGPMRLWFGGWVSHCVEELDICDADGLSYQLCKIAWMDRVLREPCRDMWMGLLQLRSMGIELRIVGDS